MQRITPFLWYDDNALEAAQFYCSIFKRSKITGASDLAVNFKLEGLRYIALNGGPHFKPTPAFSLFVRCKDQKEVDHYWKKLMAGGGKPSRCGWLTDKFGLSWQVVPKALDDCLGGKDKAGAQRALEAMMGMVKLDVKALQRAYAGPKKAKKK